MTHETWIRGRAVAALAGLMTLAATWGCGSDDATKQPPAASSDAPAKSGQATTARSAAVGSGASYLLPEHFVALVVRPQRILASPLVAAQMNDPVIQFAIKHQGIAPDEVEEFLTAFSMVEFAPQHRERAATVIIRFNRDVDAKEIAVRLTKTFEPHRQDVAEREISGKKCFTLGSDVAAVYAPDARTIIIANPIVLGKIIARGAGSSPLAARLAKVDADNDATLLLLPQSSPDFLQELNQQAEHADGMTKTYAAATQGIDCAEAKLDLQGGSLLRLDIETKDATAAAAVDDLLKDAVKMAAAQLTIIKVLLPADLKQVVTPLLNLADEALQSADIATTGNGITAVIKRPADFDAVVGRQIEQIKTIMRAKAQAALRMNNLRQIGLACYGYESSFRKFPAAAIIREGRPLLSWRVAILPYLREDDLYKQFNLDEPWDGPNNIRLLDKMPSVYRTAGRPEDGKTSIVVFTGKDTLFDGLQAASPAGILDGTSQTILAVEAGPDKAVPWTKPEDLPFDPADPAAAMGQIPPGGFAALFCDGTVRLLPKAIDRATLKALITPAGGEPIELEKLLRQ